MTYPSPLQHGEKDELKRFFPRRAVVSGAGDALAIVAAGFGRRGDQLRRSMATLQPPGTIQLGQVVGRIAERGYNRNSPSSFSSRSRVSANTAFRKAMPRVSRISLTSRFAQMSLPGRLRLRVANSQPMGFYAQAQIVRCARDTASRCFPRCRLFGFGIDAGGGAAGRRGGIEAGLRRSTRLVEAGMSSSLTRDGIALHRCAR